MENYVYFGPGQQREETRHVFEGSKCGSAAALAHYTRPDFQSGNSDQRFVTMLDAYRASGGLARSEEVLTLFRRCHGPDVSVLARWIAQRELICFEWQQQTWMPLFQIDRVHLCPDARLKSVFAELNLVYDQWEMGNWFALPNHWLAQRSPVDAFASDLSAVLDAARADRFVAAG